MSTDITQQAEFVRLYKLGLIPLRVVLPSLVWVLHDYLLTLEDEVRYIWPQKRSFGRFMFFWVRYYTIALLIFDAVQIHLFARKGFTNTSLCVAMDPTIRVVGAISLWSIEVVMQLRIYALYGSSKKIALYNGLLFAVSIGWFVGLIIDSSKRRKIVISSAMQFPLPGCPTINGGIRWAVWVPATIFEFNLFVLALYKSAVSRSDGVKLNGRLPLSTILLQDNILYFFGIACVLVLTNIMAVGSTSIPWFGYGPFHGALGIMTSRMHIHLTKCLENEGENLTHPTILPSTVEFGTRHSVVSQVISHSDTEWTAEASSSSRLSMEHSDYQ